jgi:hypothetical protein
MKCEEIKNLIIETDDLAGLEKDRQVSSHVKDCKSCLNYFIYEKNLRAGFAHICTQPMPEQLTNRLAEIPASQPDQSSSGFFANIAKLPGNFSYKTALVSCLIGFFAALLLQNDKVTQSPTSTPVMHARKAEPEIQQLQMAQAPKRKELQQDASLASEADKTDDFLPAKEEIAAIVPADEIPGAISFSIASEQTISSPEKQFTLASAKRSARGRQSERPQPMLLEQAEGAPESSFAPKEDPRIAELEQLLNSHAISLENGRLDLDELFARGLLPAERRSHFSPPPGMDWFVQNQEQGQFLKVKLAPQK